MSYPGQRLTYTRTGGSRPPVVLLHGFTEDSSTWFDLARGLENEYDLVMPDMIGHGKSDRLTPGTLVDLKQDLADLLAELRLAKAALLGHSLGALTAASSRGTLYLPCCSPGGYPLVRPLRLCL